MAEACSARWVRTIKREKSPGLCVLTALVDDRRATLRPRAPLYTAASNALHHQEAWHPREHAAFWTAALAAWPKAPGRRPIQGVKAIAVWELHRAGVPLAGVARALAIEEDSIRKERLLEIGAELRGGGSVDGAEGSALLRLNALARGERALEWGRPFPRVYVEGELLPPITWFNPLIPGEVAQREQSQGDHYLGLAREAWFAHAAACVHEKELAAADGFGGTANLRSPTR